jgi:aldose 1-epimerase
MTDVFTLRDRHWNVVVAPAHGGSLERCEFDGVPVLKPTARLERGADARACCYFPMIPFSNRIENSQFRFAGGTVTLFENVAGTRHAIHGHGWQATWQVTRRDETTCALAYRRDASSDWPWRYEGRQSFAIEDNSLRMTLAVQNLDLRPMPCGLGFHPFFPAPAGARLQLDAKRVWKGNVRDFPRERVAVPSHLSFSGGVLLSERIGTDHCFDGWQRLATLSLEQAHRAIVLEGCEATSYVIVYVPGGELCCVEPVTHAVNAMNLADPATAGLWTLEPTGTREITASLRIESLSPH